MIEIHPCKLIYIHDAAKVNCENFFSHNMHRIFSKGSLRVRTRFGLPSFVVALFSGSEVVPTVSTTVVSPTSVSATSSLTGTSAPNANASETAKSSMTSTSPSSSLETSEILVLVILLKKSQKNWWKWRCDHAEYQLKSIRSCYLGSVSYGSASTW